MKKAMTGKMAGTPTGSGSAEMRSGNAASPAVYATRVPKGSPKPSILVRSKFRITGKVQHVYFRKFTQQSAVELGTFGEVKNEDDGNWNMLIATTRRSDYHPWAACAGHPTNKQTHPAVEEGGRIEE